MTMELVTVQSASKHAKEFNHAPKEQEHTGQLNGFLPTIYVLWNMNCRVSVCTRNSKRSRSELSDLPPLILELKFGIDWGGGRWHGTWKRKEQHNNSTLLLHPIYLNLHNLNIHDDYLMCSSEHSWWYRIWECKGSEACRSSFYLSCLWWADEPVEEGDGEGGALNSNRSLSLQLQLNQLLLGTWPSDLRPRTPKLISTTLAANGYFHRSQNSKLWFKLAKAWTDPKPEKAWFE